MEHSGLLASFERMIPGQNCCSILSTETDVLPICSSHNGRVSNLAQEVTMKKSKNTPKRGRPDLMSLSVVELTRHIEETHHDYARSELARLRQLLDQVVCLHQTEHPQLSDLRRLFYELKADLELHMLKEEQTLFPWCRRLEQQSGLAQSNFKSIANSIRVMQKEHDSIQLLMNKISSMLNDFLHPPNTCPKYQALLLSLNNLWADLETDMNKECNILFPRIVTLEENHGNGAH